MSESKITREAMWAKQSLHPQEIDYAIWDRDRCWLEQMSERSRSCTFVVDVYQCRYTFASSNFAGLFGYDGRKLETIGQRDDDYLESRIHPEDLAGMKSMQVDLARFIYNQPAEERNDYKNLFSYRVLNSRQQYVNVTSRQQVLEVSSKGKAWLILGMMEIAADQRLLDGVRCTVLNMKTGTLFSPFDNTTTRPELTVRETEILQLIKQGLLSKEIAYRLGISIHTVHIHRQHILRKLGVQNSIEAINLGGKAGLII